MYLCCLSSPVAAAPVAATADDFPKVENCVQSITK